MKSFLSPIILLCLLGVVLSNNPTDFDSIKASINVSVSGISSGGAMAGQMLVAHSSKISGAGIFAAPPYFCTRGVAATVLDCMTTGFTVYPTQLVLAAEGFQTLNLIDNLSNLINSKIYFFSGKKDSVVWSGIVKKNAKFFEKLGADIKTEYSISAEHTFPTDFFGNKCGKLGSPYINNCDFKGAKYALEHILDDTLNPKVEYKQENLLTFSQDKYKIGVTHSLADSGLIYVPDNCKDKECELHVAFHGCDQTINDIGLDYVYGTGFLGLAEANDIIVLFPQIKTSKVYPYNPKGCWDWWGYSEIVPTPVQWSFPTKEGVQVQAVYNMIVDLQKGTFAIDSDFAYQSII